MIEYVEQHGVAIVSLKHGKANALDLELVERLRQTFASIAESEAKAVVLTAEGKIFCAGVDLFRVVNEGAEYVRRFFPALVRMLEEFFLLPRPVIAALNGHAIAGGCILAAASDYRFVAGGGARIGVPELMVGVPFPAIALEVLRFAFPKQHLEELIYTGNTFLGEEALVKGIVDQIVDPDLLMEQATDMAIRLGNIAGRSFRLAKEQLRGPVVARARELVDADRHALEIWCATSTHDHIRAYLDRTVGKK